jgi:hypothetical protein
MAVKESDPVLAKIRKAIRVTDLNPAPLRPLFEPDGRQLRVPMAELIERVEQKLGVSMPPWLREVYLSCNGFLGPYRECILYPLDGSEGVEEFTQFLRDENWAPPWLNRAIVFGYTGGSDSTTAHSVVLDGQLVEWCYADGAKFSVVEGDLFDLWRRLQAEWDRAIR